MKRKTSRQRKILAWGYVKPHIIVFAQICWVRILSACTWATQHPHIDGSIAARLLTMRVGNTLACVACHQLRLRTDGGCYWNAWVTHLATTRAGIVILDTWTLRSLGAERSYYLLVNWSNCAPLLVAALTPRLCRRADVFVYTHTQWSHWATWHIWMCSHPIGWRGWVFVLPMLCVRALGDYKYDKHAPTYT